MNPKKMVATGVPAFLCVIACFASGAPRDGTALKSPKTKLADFQWLTGSWQGKAFGGDYDEHWTPATGTIMMGVARTVRDGKTSHYEALRLEETADGIVLTAFLPKEGKFNDGTPFKLTKFVNREAVFENPEHDFPTRIIYRRSDDDSLFARIEGLRNGALTGVDFPLKRLKENR